MIKVIGLNIKVLKKEPFSGSHQGMRFFMRAEDDTLHVWVYPEPWCFEKTSDDMKTAKDFPFTQEGLDDSMEWISQEFENRKDYWMQMEKDKMKMILQVLRLQNSEEKCLQTITKKELIPEEKYTTGWQVNLSQNPKTQIQI